jgi:hypothetical protein
MQSGGDNDDQSLPRPGLTIRRTDSSKKKQAAFQPKQVRGRVSLIHANLPYVLDK